MFGFTGQILSIAGLVAAEDVSQLLQRARSELYDVIYASIAPQWRALVELNRDGMQGSESAAQFLMPKVMDPTDRYERLRTLTISTQAGTSFFFFFQCFRTLFVIN